MRNRPYECYKPSEIDWLGRIPAHWSTPALGTRYRVELGKMLDASRITGAYPTPYVRNVDVQWEGINLEDLPEMDIREDEYARYTLTAGDLLVCEGGEVGRAAIFPGSADRVGFQKAIHRLRPLRGDEVTSFLLFTLRAAAQQGVFTAEGNPNTIDHLTAEKLRRHRFPKPPRPEQEDIAAFLERETTKLDELVARKHKVLDLLKEQRSALISRTVTHGLPPDAAVAAGLDPHAEMKDSGIEWLGDVPVHWELGKFSREVHIAEGQVDPQIEPFDSMILIAPNHIESGTGRLLQTETASEQGAISGKYFAKRGDVIYSKIRPALAKVAVAPEDCLCSADMYPMNGRSKVINPFLYWFLLSRQFVEWSVLEADRVAMPKINRETLAELRLPIPPLNEQTEIARFLATEAAKLDRLTMKVEEAIERLREYRSALITAAVTGKIDVRATSDTPAAL